MHSVNKTPNIIAINFNFQEQRLIASCLLNAPKTNLHFSDFEKCIDNLQQLDSIELALINFEEYTSKTLKQFISLKKELLQLPKIIFCKEINHFDLDSFGNKIIDVRLLNPIELTSKSIKRELSLQHHRSLFHASRVKAKNEHSRFNAFLRNTEDGVALIHGNQYWSVNDAYKRIFNIPSEEHLTNAEVEEFNMSSQSQPNVRKKGHALNTSLDSLPDNKTVSVLIQKRGGESFVTTLYKTPCLVDDTVCTQILIHNPNAWSDIDKGFTDLRSYDHETGIHNKKFIIEHLNNKLKEDDARGSIAIILIEDFRQLRNKFNFEQTNSIIQSIASIIQESCSKNDILARYGDAVFSLFSYELDRSEFLLHCQKIITDVNNTIFGDDSQYQKISLSIGVSFIDNKIATAEQLLVQADKACENASKNDGEKIHVFDSVSTPLNIIIEEAEGVNLIQNALEQNRLHTLFQPIVDLSEKTTENYAVLLRIMDEKNNHIPPDNFILTAERTGLISQLDEWVLRHTIQQIRQASRQGIKRKFFITLSINTYRHYEFIETLMADMKFYGIDPKLLVFQINFADLQADPHTLKNFITIIKKDCGCQLAFDQVGFSEITDAMLKTYAVDYIKIDGSFSQTLLNDPSSKKTIQDLVTVTRRNGVRTIAKSVENANALAMLWNIGIDAVQGYFLQEPADIMQFDFSLND
ncbi:MAG: GGDEF-domain containing protein [Piscirickettsiaceae bacterium]|nr:MAG: GGDEF-domain containing protein [Piscirickettsiaceae bacterium]